MLIWDGISSPIDFYKLPGLDYPVAVKLAMIGGKTRAVRFTGPALFKAYKKREWGISNHLGQTALQSRRPEDAKR